MIFKVVLVLFVAIFFSACFDKDSPTTQKNTAETQDSTQANIQAKDSARVTLHNDLTKLKEGIWKVEEWKKMARKICKDSKNIDCSMLAEVYHDYVYGYGHKSDIQKSMKMLKGSCDMGDAKSCMQLAIYNVDVKDVEKSNTFFAKTYELSEKKCGEGYAVECFVLSQMHFVGYAPVQRDREMAVELANKSCDMKLANACVFLAINGNQDESLQGRKKACDLGVKEYCK